MLLPSSVNQNKGPRTDFPSRPMVSRDIPASSLIEQRLPLQIKSLPEIVAVYSHDKLTVSGAHGQLIGGGCFAADGGQKDDGAQRSGFPQRRWPSFGDRSKSHRQFFIVFIDAIHDMLIFLSLPHDFNWFALNIKSAFTSVLRPSQRMLTTPHKI